MTTRDERAPSYVDEVVLESLEHILSYTPGNNAHRISPTPLMVILAEDDQWTPNDLVLAAYDKVDGPKQLVTVPGGHYSVYDGPGHEVAATSAAQFFMEHLSEQPGSAT